MIRRVPVHFFSQIIQTPQVERNSSQPINPDGRQILDMQGDEGTSEPVPHIFRIFRGVLVFELTCEPVRLPFKTAADGVHTDANDGFQRRQNHL